MDLQKEQVSNAPGLGWMIVIVNYEIEIGIEMRSRVTNVKPYICPSITPMATKFDRVATGDRGLHL